MWFYHRVMCPKDEWLLLHQHSDLWSGSTLFAETFMFENLRSLQYSQKSHKTISLMKLYRCRQLALADVIIVNKTDLVKEEELSKLKTDIR